MPSIRHRWLKTKEFYMSKYSKKNIIGQKELARRQKIEDAKKEWNESASKLAQEKEELNYKAFPWDAFMEINPDDAQETSTQSKIIDLQERYTQLTEQHNFIWAEDNIVDNFNQRHAIIHIDQTFILTEKINTRGEADFSLESRQSFSNYYEDEVITCIDGIERSKSYIWLKSPRRRKYEGLIFDPCTIGPAHNYYNLWKGFARHPRQGLCQKYWNHVKDNICNGDIETYQYVRKWLAYVFQQPHIVHTALVLCGSQGVGKNSFVDPLGVLFGTHFAPLSSISELVSNFNYHLKNAVLIHANEALWGGNKKEIGTVKTMITDEFCLIEGKGKDRIRVPNFKHVILSSNEDWPVHLDSDDRRFLVLKVNEAHKEDHEYFKSIKDELENGGYEALLHDLLHEDITSFEPRRFPSNSNAFHIKMRSADSTYRYIFEMLSEEGFKISNLSPNECPAWQTTISKNDLYSNYADWCKESGETPQTKEQFGKAINKLIVSVETFRPAAGKSRSRHFKFPSLRQCRKDFAKAFKEDPERIFEGYNDYVQDEVQEDEFQ
jgi:hypothetical protein